MIGISKLIAPFVMATALFVAACTNPSATAIDPLSGFAELKLDTDKTVCSGVFISKDKVLSAKHCFGSLFGEVPVTVKDTTDKTYKIKDVWTSKDEDVAILTLDTEYEGPIRELSCSVPSIGDKLTAVGYPSFIEHTVITNLITSWIGDDHTTWGNNFILATGVTLPGMSGGPWFDQEGKVVGVTSFEYLIGDNDYREDTDLNGGALLSKVKELCNGNA